MLGDEDQGTARCEGLGDTAKARHEWLSRDASVWVQFCGRCGFLFKLSVPYLVAFNLKKQGTLYIGPM